MQNKVYKFMSMSQMPICGNDTATNLILSQFQGIGVGLVLPTVTGAMFVCGDMAPWQSVMEWLCVRKRDQNKRERNRDTKATMYLVQNKWKKQV